tara:strand:+ start:104 stop:385 length:282 start_codon:yes stop_codon:yes gene_type:complete
VKKVGMLIVVLGWIAAIVLCLRPELALRLRMWFSGVGDANKKPDVQNRERGGIILLPGGKTDGQKEESSTQDVEETESTSQGDPRSGPDPPLL